MWFNLISWFARCYRPSFFFISDDGLAEYIKAYRAGVRINYKQYVQKCIVLEMHD